MPKVLIAGGGLAGLSAAAALGGAGFPDVELYEARAFLGGRGKFSYSAPAAPGEEAETIDNCQHVPLRCCDNLLDFYSRGWASGTASGSTASSISWNRGGSGCRRFCSRGRATGCAAAFRRVLFEDGVRHVAIGEGGDCARACGCCARSGRSVRIWSGSACSTGCCRRTPAGRGRSTGSGGRCW